MSDADDWARHDREAALDAEEELRELDRLERAVFRHDHLTEDEEE